MKAATFGLVLGALSIANAQIFEDEDTFLQEEWEDIEGDRELQFVDEESELELEPVAPTDTMAEYVEPEPVPEGEMEEGGERKRKRRNNRRRDRRRNRRNRKGRKGRKGKKGRKGRKGRKGKKKGPFNIDEYNKRLVSKTKMMEKKLKMKCKKRAKFADKFCQQREDVESCKDWAKAMQTKCQANGQCAMTNKGNVGKCSGGFKLMLASFRSEEVKVVADMNSATVGKCYETALQAAEKCQKDAQQKISNALQGVQEPSEEDLKRFKEEMKAERKAKRDEKRRARRNKRNQNRRNKRRNRKNKNRRNNRRDRRNSNEDEGESDNSAGSQDSEGEE